MSTEALIELVKEFPIFLTVFMRVRKGIKYGMGLAKSYEKKVSVKKVLIFLILQCLLFFSLFIQLFDI